MAMMAATMTMFQLALSVTELQNSSYVSHDSTAQDTKQRADQRLWLRLLQNSSEVLKNSETGLLLSSKDLCDQLICRINSLEELRCEGNNNLLEGYESLAEFTLMPIPTNMVATHAFPDACVLTSGQLHRALVVPNPEEPAMPYRLYACMTNEKLCSFELRQTP